MSSISTQYNRFPSTVRNAYGCDSIFSLDMKCNWIQRVSHSFQSSKGQLFFYCLQTIVAVFFASFLSPTWNWLCVRVVNPKFIVYSPPYIHSMRRTKIIHSALTLTLNICTLYIVFNTCFIWFLCISMCKAVRSINVPSSFNKCSTTHSKIPSSTIRSILMVCLLRVYAKDLELE